MVARVFGGWRVYSQSSNSSGVSGQGYNRVLVVKVLWFSALFIRVLVVRTLWSEFWCSPEGQGSVVRVLVVRVLVVRVHWQGSGVRGSTPHLRDETVPGHFDYLKSIM